MQHLINNSTLILNTFFQKWKLVSNFAEKWLCSRLGMLSQWDETGKSSIENENDEVKRAPESYPGEPVPVPRPTRRVAMATEPLIMVVTRFGQWPWQLHRVGLVFGRGQTGRGNCGVESWFCLGISVLVFVRALVCVTALSLSTSRRQRRLAGRVSFCHAWSWNETRACAGKGQSTALRCICQILLAKSDKFNMADTADNCEHNSDI